MHFLSEAQKIHFLREDCMRVANHSVTPDCLILDDLFINGHLVRWIDAKSYYGSGLVENKNYFNRLGRQIRKYEEEYGASGAIIFQHGYSKKMEESYSTTLFLDAGPVADFVVES